MSTKFKKFQLLALSLLACVNIYANESSTWLAASENKSNTCSFKPLQISSVKRFENRQAFYFEFNPAFGFVYFSGVHGSLSGQPADDFRPFNDVPLKRKLEVNRGPAFESTLGFRPLYWMGVSMAYQYQGNLAVKSVMCPSANEGARTINVQDTYSQFQSNLSLNAILLKLSFQSPVALIYRQFSVTPYFNASIGGGWQSWTRMLIQRQFVGGAANLFFSEPQYLRQKISANPVWALDAGLNILRLKPKTDFSVVAGCRFTSWGKSGHLGKTSEQTGYRAGLLHPVKIDMVYSFAPYLGVNWNFVASSTAKKPLLIRDRSPNTFKPYFVSLKCIEVKKMGFTSFNVGPNFLYYSGLRGNLFGRPDANFGVWGSIPLKGPLSSNKAPLMEAIWGVQWASWIKGAISYQHLAGITLQTKLLNGSSLAGSSGTNDFSQFQSNLEIDAILLKAYFQLPRGMIFKNLAFSPYLAVGGGVSWQSWTQMQINRSDLDAVGYNADPQPLRLKVIANGSFLVDVGVRLQSVLRQNNLLLMLGCKYNQWGQVRNLGKIQDQSPLVKGLNHPIRMKVLYSFAPYAGVQWNFPMAQLSQSPGKIRGISVARFWPFFAHNRAIQAKQSPFIQFNVGCGFLYFDKISGALTATPATPFRIYGPIALKKSMIYNRTPLFEYLLGYRFTQWLKAAISYQYQGGISFQTQVLDALNPPIFAQNFDSRHAQFQANLSLNAIMAKVFFELPYSMISTGIATTPYLAAGVGAGWQNWTQIQVNRMYDLNTFISEPQSLRQKVSGNAVWMIDVGCRLQSAGPCSPFSVTAGCKYVQWGQARSMGEVRDQQTISMGLLHPFKIRTVYSFAPYLGMQWNF